MSHIRLVCYKFPVLQHSHYIKKNSGELRKEFIFINVSIQTVEAKHSTPASLQCPEVLLLHAQQVSLYCTSVIAGAIYFKPSFQGSNWNLKIQRCWKFKDTAILALVIWGLFCWLLLLFKILLYLLLSSKYYLSVCTVAQRLRRCATNRKVAGSIFHWHNPSSRTMVLGSTQPLLT
jgi:hypothetical protein